MTIARWNPPVAPTRQEQFLLKRLGRVRKLFAFLRLHRHELFDDGVQEELAAMYRRTGAGKPALPPALMAMATLVQGYLGVSDAEMVELTVVDLRVQLVLGCLGAEAPPFSQGALQEFRERLIAADLDRRVLERTVELAKRTKAFDHRKLPKTLRVAIDSSPLEGAGRVEDTYNLLAHAARNVLRRRGKIAVAVAQRSAVPQIGVPAEPARPYDHVPQWASPTRDVRHDGRVRPGRLRPLLPARAVHHGGTRARPHGRHRRTRAAAAPPAEAAADVGGTGGAARAHHD